MLNMKVNVFAELKLKNEFAWKIDIGISSYIYLLNLLATLNGS